MKKHLTILLILALLLGGCAPRENADIAATTLPVYQFTTMLCEGTGLTVTRLIRVREGGLLLGDLKRGEWRVLTEEELKLLRHENASKL